MTTPSSAPAQVCSTNTSFSEEEALAATLKARENKAKLVEVCPDVYWVGAVDWNVRDFHGINTIKGSSYNSYLILGPRPTLVDTVKAPFAHVLLANIRAIIDPRLVRYVVINHAEPDHSSAMGEVMHALPNAQVLCTAKTRDGLLRNYKGAKAFDAYNSGGHFHDCAATTTHTTSASADASSWEYCLIKSGETLSLGPSQTLFFFDTPMVHWPESMFTYLLEHRVLFSMDAFGQHIGSVARFDDELLSGFGSTGGAPTVDDLIECARSYYANILMPFGRPILNALGKFLEALARVETVRDEGRPLPRVLATAHGIMWRANVDRIVALYQRWAAHRVLPKVLVLYDTMYGATERMARAIWQGAAEYVDPENGKRCQAVILCAKTAHYTRTADEMLDSAALAIGSPTLNTGVLPSLGDHMTFLKGLRPDDRTGLAFGSYGWGPTGTNVLAKWLAEANFDVLRCPITVQFSADEPTLRQCYEAGRDLARIAVQKGVEYSF